MNYLSLSTTVTNTEQYLSATTAQRGIWFTMLTYCAIAENDGIIENFTSWSKLKIQRTFHCKPLAVLSGKSSLWSIVDENLIVHLYPTSAQQKVVAKRENMLANIALSPSSQLIKNINTVSATWHDMQFNLAEKQALRENLANLKKITQNEYELLAAYYNAVHYKKQTTAPNKKPYYAPVARQQFITNIVDILGHAKIWQKHYGYKSPAKEKPHTPPQQTPPPSELDRQFCIDELNKLKNI